MRLPTAELEALAWSEVQTYVPSMKSAKLIRSAVTRNPEATWLPKPGVVRAPNKTTDPRVAIAGSWTNTGWPDTMESAVRSGINACVILSVGSEANVVAEPRKSPADQGQHASRASIETASEVSA